MIEAFKVIADGATPMDKTLLFLFMCSISFAIAWRVDMGKSMKACLAREKACWDKFSKLARRVNMLDGKGDDEKETDG